MASDAERCDTQTPPDSAKVRATQDIGRAGATGDTTDVFGDLSPGKGFLVSKTEAGTLNISAYMMARYLNQLPPSQTYVDHLGRLREVDPRNDIQWHRVMVHFMGWMYLPRLQYVASVWTVNATEQVRVVGSLTYNFSQAFRLSIGVNGLPGTRSLNGSHPLWLAPDRVMADEYFRPGFTQGAWISGEPFKRFFYQAMVGNNISQLGVSAAELTRNLAYAGTVWWLPTTGEFGPRGGWGDYDWHENLAVRMGTSFTRSREDRASQLDQSSPDNTQIRISDGLLLFETGALADAVTVQKATYALSAVDLGFKYRGWFLQGEMYHRWLGSFDADGALPILRMYDKGWYLVLSAFPIKRTLELYTGTSRIYGEFNRCWEMIGGFNWYPAPTRYFRINANLLRVQRSPVGSTFGYYVSGLHGGVVSLAAALFF